MGEAALTESQKEHGRSQSKKWCYSVKILIESAFVSSSTYVRQVVLESPIYQPQFMKMEALGEISR